MAIVRATQRLSKALGVKLQPWSASAETNKLGEWYANTVESALGALVVLINAPTRLVLVSQALDPKALSHDLAKRLKRLLGSLNVPAEIAEREAQGFESLMFTKTADRQLIGSLNEVCSVVAPEDGYAHLVRSADLDVLEDDLAEFVHMRLPDTHPSAALRTLLGESPQKRSTLRLVRSANAPAQPRTPPRASLRVAAEGESPLYLPGPLTPEDIARLAGAPLRLTSLGPWAPKELAYDDPSSLWPLWLESVMAAGKRASFEMEEVASTLGGTGGDPIFDAVELAASGKRKQAEASLWRLVERDIRCLDAHAHLGNFAFDKHPGDALAHYSMGAHIGRYALRGCDRPVLPWSALGNRPFLRCLHGVGLCLWRLKRNDEAARVFTDMLWLNPNDNQGARFCLSHIEDGTAWREDLD